MTADQATAAQYLARLVTRRASSLRPPTMRQRLAGLPASALVASAFSRYVRWASAADHCRIWPKAIRWAAGLPVAFWRGSEPACGQPSPSVILYRRGHPWALRADQRCKAQSMLRSMQDRWLSRQQEMMATSQASARPPIAMGSSALRLTRLMVRARSYSNIGPAVAPGPIRQSVLQVEAPRQAWAQPGADGIDDPSLGRLLHLVDWLRNDRPGADATRHSGWTSSRSRTGTSPLLRK